MNQNEQVVQTAVNQVVAKLHTFGEELAESGYGKELYLSALIFAVAQVSRELKVPTAKMGIALSQARQNVDNNTLMNKKPI